jgi:hypothetical protein
MLMEYSLLPLIFTQEIYYGKSKSEDSTLRHQPDQVR